MIKIAVESSVNQVKRLIDKLSLREKMRLLRTLERETLKQRWKDILGGIDKKLKKFPISQKEINSEIKAYRKAKHAKSRS